MHIPDNALFYEVTGTPDTAPLRDHLEHGYESRRDFRTAVRDLLALWKGRVGEGVDERHGFRKLRFHDTPGGCPDEAWIPLYLLKEVPRPAYTYTEEVDETEKALDEAFGFG